MQILIRKYTAKPVFHPHFNRAMGKYYHTSSDYYGDLKAKGLQPASKEEPKSKRTPYKMSEWGKAMAEEIKNGSKNGKYKPSDRFITEMKKKGMDYTEQGLKKSKKYAEKLNTNTGGFEN